MIVKSPELRPDLAATQVAIGKQLNLGVSGVMLVTVETAAEARAGIAAMRFKSQGGTRSDDVGQAPAVWGMSEAEYRQKADLWPLNPNGELINWTIVESKKGLENLKEIAAVPGVGVLWPGAGTLRGVFSTTDAAGVAHRRHGGLGSGDSAGAERLQGQQDRLRLPGHCHRHRQPHGAGLQGVRDELGRRRLQDRRSRPPAGRPHRRHAVGRDALP